jgi:hypothetical protein
LLSRISFQATLLIEAWQIGFDDYADYRCLAQNLNKAMKESPERS